jgi:hypothetical protein
MTCRWTAKWYLLVAVGLCNAVLLRAVNPPAQHEYAAGDTWIQRGTPDTVYGASTILFIKRDFASRSGSTDRIGYLRFDTAGLMPGAVMDARLLLTMTDGVGASTPYEFGLYGLPDGDADELFAEDSLTYATAARASSGHPGSVQVSGTVLLGTIAGLGLDKPQTVELQTPALTQFLRDNSNGVATMILLRHTADGALPSTFVSNQGVNVAQRPVLLVYTAGDSWPVVAASASSVGTDDPVQAAHAAVDGNFQTRWVAAADSADSQQRAWLSIDLGAPRPVNELLFVAHTHGRSYRFEASADGQVWTVVDSGFGSGAGTVLNANRRQTRRLFATVTARYFRLTSLTTVAGSALSLWEVQLRYELQEAGLRTRAQQLAQQAAALPCGDPADCLHKALLEWAVEDALLDLADGDLAAAAATLDDTEARMAHPPQLAADAEARLFAAAPQPATNFLFVQGIADARREIANAPVFSRGQEFDPRKPALAARRILHAIGHPQVPADLAHNAAGFKVFLRQLQAVFDHAARVDMDYFAKSDLGLAWLLYRSRYPAFILPSKLLRWEAQLLEMARVEATRTRGKEFVNINQEALKWLMLTCIGLHFQDADLLQVADERLAAFGRALFPDGGFPYSNLSNEANEYHHVDLLQLYYYGVLTGSPVPNQLIQRSRWYYPLTMRRGPMAEWNTPHIAKDRWNGVSGKDGAYLVASLTGCSHNYRTAVDGGLNFGDLFLASRYRSDLVRTPEPDNWTAFDRNIRGIRGRSGDFSFWINGNNRHEMNSLAGCMILNPGSGLGFTCNAAVAKLGSFVRTATGPTVVPPEGREVAMAELADSNTLDTITTDTFGSVASVHGLTEQFYGEPLPGWTAREQWVVSPHGMTGRVRLHANVAVSAYGIGGIIKLFSYRVAGVRKTWQQLDDRTWAYGRLRVRIHQHDFADVHADYSFVQETNGSEARLGAGRLLLRDHSAIATDSQALNPAAFAVPTPTQYPAGTQRQYIVEIYPDTEVPADSVIPIDLPSGLTGWESYRQHDDVRRRLIHNPGATPITYTAVIPWLRNFTVHHSGEQYRAPWLADFDTASFTDPRGPLPSLHTPSRRVFDNMLVVTIPPGGHIVCASIPDLAPTTDADGDGRSNIAEYIAGTDPFDARDFMPQAFSAVPASNEFRLTITPRSNRAYAIQRSFDLQPDSWQTIASHAPAMAPVSDFSLQVPLQANTPGFFRIMVSFDPP